MTDGPINFDQYFQRAQQAQQQGQAGQDVNFQQQPQAQQLNQVQAPSIPPQPEGLTFLMRTPGAGWSQTRIAPRPDFASAVLEAWHNMREYSRDVAVVHGGAVWCIVSTEGNVVMLQG